MTNPILNFSSNQTLSNYLVSVSDAQALIDASLVTSGIPTFDNATAYVTGNIVYYLGVFYIAPSNIGSGGGTPLVNTTWRQIPTWGSYTTTATAAGTTTLDLYSSEIQRFSGVTTQTVVLPVVTTLPALGKPFYIINDSTGTLTVNSSGGNLVATILAGQRYLINCILLTGTTAASWTVSSGSETATSIGAIISGSTAKTVLVDADLIPLDDSAASNILKNITWQNLKASIFAYTTTATAAGTTTLTAASTMYQFFTGSTTQTVILPVTSTLYTGLKYIVYNNSSGLVTVQSSGANTILILAGGTSAEFVCILTSGTSAASWQLKYDGTIVTSGKKLSATASLTLAGTDAKTLTVSNSLTLAGTDSTVMTFPSTSATIARTDAANTFTGVQTMTSPAITTANLIGVTGLNGDLQLAENVSILLDAALSADGKWSGICETGVCGETLAFGNICYFKAADSRWWLSDADAEATSGPVKLAVCVTAGTAGQTQTFMLKGKINAASLYPTLTIGAPVYLSGTAGNIIVAEPTSGFIRVVGHANTGDEIYFNPSSEYYERGTWTATFEFGSATTGITYSSNSSRYWKRGKEINLRGFSDLSSKGSATGSFAVSGVPFTNQSTYHLTAPFYGSTITYTGMLMIYFGAAQAKFIVQQIIEAGTVSTLDNTSFSNNSGMIYNLTYNI